MPIKSDEWFDDEGNMDFEEVQEDLSFASDMVGMAQRGETNRLQRQAGKALNEQNKILAEQLKLDQAKAIAEEQEKRTLAALPKCCWCNSPLKNKPKVCAACQRTVAYFTVGSPVEKKSLFIAKQAWEGVSFDNEKDLPTFFNRLIDNGTIFLPFEPTNWSEYREKAIEELNHCKDLAGQLYTTIKHEKERLSVYTQFENDVNGQLSIIAASRNELEALSHPKTFLGKRFTRLEIWLATFVFGFVFLVALASITVSPFFSCFFMLIGALPFVIILHHWSTKQNQFEVSEVKNAHEIKMATSRKKVTDILHKLCLFPESAADRQIHNLKKRLNKGVVEPQIHREIKIELRAAFDRRQQMVSTELTVVKLRQLLADVYIPDVEESGYQVVKTKCPHCNETPDQDYFASGVSVLCPCCEQNFKLPLKEIEK